MKNAINENIELILGDCLQEMKNIEDKSIDCVICDLPYGTTNCQWDIIIPFDKLWEEYDRICKDNAAICLFGSEPFSSHLRLSNLKDYRYDLYWVKEKPTNFFQLKRRFGKTTENISIFYKNQPTYNPQMVKHEGKLVTNSPKAKHNSIVSGISNKNITKYNDTGYRYPCDILKFNRVKLGSYMHPTEKPVQLIEYLIRSFTNENDLILDNTAGSMTTAIVAINTNRRCICIEKDDNYYNIGLNRVTKHLEDKQLM